MFKYAFALLGLTSAATVSRAELRQKLNMFKVQVRETDAVDFGNRVHEFQGTVENHVQGAVNDTEVQNQMWWIGYRAQVVGESKPMKDLMLYHNYIEEAKRNQMFPSNYTEVFEVYMQEEARFQELDAQMQNQETTVLGHEPERTWSTKVNQDDWDALNAQYTVLKEMRLAMKDLPIFTHYRQLCLNLRYSEEFEALNTDFQAATNNTRWQAVVSEAHGIRENVHSLLRMSNRSKQLFWHSVMMEDVALMVDAAFAAGEGNVDQLVDIFVNGNNDGTLHRNLE